MVFISTVLSRPETLPPKGPGRSGGATGDDAHLGFWRNPKRFNVAITRAKVRSLRRSCSHSCVSSAAALDPSAANAISWRRRKAAGAAGLAALVLSLSFLGLFQPEAFPASRHCMYKLF